MRGLFLLLEQKFIKLIKARFTYEKNRIHIHRIQHVLQWSSVIWSTVTGLLALFSFIFEILNYNRYLPTRTMKIRVRHSLICWRENLFQLILMGIVRQFFGIHVLWCKVPCTKSIFTNFSHPLMVSRPSRTR